MTLSLSTLSASLLENLSEILEYHEQLHTVSIEFTVLRENGRQIGFEVFTRCLLAEQKDTESIRIHKNVDEFVKELESNVE